MRERHNRQKAAVTQLATDLGADVAASQNRERAKVGPRSDAAQRRGADAVEPFELAPVRDQAVLPPHRHHGICDGRVVSSCLLLTETNLIVRVGPHEHRGQGSRALLIQIQPRALTAVECFVKGTHDLCALPLVLAFHEGGLDQDLVVGLFAKALNTGIGYAGSRQKVTKPINLGSVGELDNELCPASEVDPHIETDRAQGHQRGDDQSHRDRQQRAPVLHEVDATVAEKLHGLPYGVRWRDARRGCVGKGRGRRSVGC